MILNQWVRYRSMPTLQKLKNSFLLINNWTIDEQVIIDKKLEIQCDDWHLPSTLLYNVYTYAQITTELKWMQDKMQQLKKTNLLLLSQRIWILWVIRQCQIIVQRTNQMFESWRFPSTFQHCSRASVFKSGVVNEPRTWLRWKSC